MAWKHNFKPPNGEGWGGPAKGASTSRYSADNPPDNKGAVVKGKIKAEALRMILAGDIPDVADMWREVMKDKNAPAMARIVAGEKIAERVEGKVPNVNVNASAGPLDELSDDELRAGIEHLRRRIAGADAEGVGEARGGEPPGDVSPVH